MSKLLDMDIMMSSLRDAQRAINWLLEDSPLDVSDDAKLNSISKLANSIYIGRLTFYDEGDVEELGKTLTALTQSGEG